jgi:hypothetical protein
MPKSGQRLKERLEKSGQRLKERLEKSGQRLKERLEKSGQHVGCRAVPARAANALPWIAWPLMAALPDQASSRPPPPSPRVRADARDRPAGRRAGRVLEVGPAGATRPAPGLHRHPGLCTRLARSVIVAEPGVLSRELRNDVSGTLDRPGHLGDGSCTGPGLDGLCGGRPAGSGKIQATMEKSASLPLAAPRRRRYMAPGSSASQISVVACAVPSFTAAWSAA